MGFVLKADCSAGDSFVVFYQTNLWPTEWWLTVEAGVPSSTLAALIGASIYSTASFSNAPESNTLLSPDGLYLGDSTNPSSLSSPCDVTSFDNPGAVVANVFTPDAWHTIEQHSDSATMEWYVDGTLVMSYSLAESVPTADLDALQVGGFQSGGFHSTSVPGEVYYIKSAKLGTSRGGTDLFADYFSSGDLTAWSETDNAVSVVADPLSTAASVGGVSLALDDGPHVASPTWIRLDTLDGVGIDSISIHRGRTDERSKTEPGTVTITGTDTLGLLDPTNSTGPFYGRLEPVKQASVTLYNPVTGDWHPIFRGHVETYRYTVDPSAKWTEFEITLVDMLDVLNDAEVVPDEAGNTVPAESAGDCFYTGQHVDDRILAVLADSSTAFMAQTWPSELLQIASGNVFVQGRVYANRTSLLQVLDEACDAEFVGATNRFITKDGSFAFRGRFYRFSPTFYAAASDAARAIGHELVHWNVGDIPAFNGDSSLAVFTGLKFERGKTNVINAALVTPDGISDSDLASNINFSSDSTSITAFGPRTSGMSLENLITDNADDGNDALQETASFADATVQNYKDPVTYVSELTFRNPPGGDIGARASRVWAVLTGVELSDLVTVTSTHPGGGGFSGEDHYVESISYQIGPLQGNEWDVTLTLGLSSKQHFTYMPAAWNPPGG